MELDPYGVPRRPRVFPLPAPRVLWGPVGPAPRLIDGGHLGPILRTGLLESCLRWAREIDDDFVIWAGPSPRVIVVRPESARRVLLGGHDFVRNALPTSNLFSRGLLRLEGAPWRRRRDALAPAFSPDAMRVAIEIIHDETDHLIDRWGTRSGTFRPARDLSFTMLRVLGRFSFGVDFDEERHQGKMLHRALITLSTDAVIRHLLGRAASTMIHGRAVRRALRRLDRTCAEILEVGRDTPLMTALRSMLHVGELDRRTVLVELRSLLVAGHETSATALSWAVAMLAQYPELAGPLREDGLVARAVTEPRHAQGLHAALRWVRETMRLYPPVPVSVSQSIRALTLGRVEMPARCRVDVLSFLLHRSPRLWVDPEKFRPERFLTKPRPGSYFPFLVGPHTCMGIHLAMLELPLVLSRLAASFDFELPDGPPEVNLRISLHPKNFTARVRARAGGDAG